MSTLLRCLRFCLTSEGQQAVLAAVICLVALQIFADDAAALQVGSHLLYAFFQKKADLTKKVDKKSFFGFKKVLFSSFCVCTVASGFLLMVLQLYRSAHTFHTLCCTVACGENLHANHTVSFCCHGCLIHYLGSHTNLAHTHAQAMWAVMDQVL